MYDLIIVSRLHRLHVYTSTPRRLHRHHNDVNPIDWINEWKYLGVVLKSGRRFGCSVTERVKSFYRSLNAILRVDGRSDDMVLLRLLEARCVPLITYAVETIIIADRDQRRSLRVAYNSIYIGSCLVTGTMKVSPTFNTVLGVRLGKSWLKTANVDLFEELVAVTMALSFMHFADSNFSLSLF